MRVLRYILLLLCVFSLCVAFGIAYLWRTVVTQEELLGTEAASSSVSTTTKTEEIQKDAQVHEEIDDVPAIESGTSSESGSLPEEKPTEEAITIPDSALTNEQRAILTAFGIDPKSVVITPTTIQCIYGKIGNDRALALQNGDTPSFSEALSILACIRT